MSAGLAPRDATEHTIARLCADLLGRDTVPVDTDFFSLGGTSLMALHLLTEIERTYGVQVPIATLLRGATVAHLAEVVRIGGQRAETLITLRAEGTRAPFSVCIRPAAAPSATATWLSISERASHSTGWNASPAMTGCPSRRWPAPMSALYERCNRTVLTSSEGGRLAGLSPSRWRVSSRGWRYGGSGRTHRQSSDHTRAPNGVPALHDGGQCGPAGVDRSAPGSPGGP